MQQSATNRRTSRTAIAIMLAVVGMLALGGAWSSATASEHGANQGGPFDSTPKCEGTNQGNSQNCNGSQGNADDKNPPGQIDNEHSRGYECGDNKGVGNNGGNPAHTGCTTTTSPGADIEGCVGVCDTTTTTTTTTTLAPTTDESIPDEVLGLTEERPGALGAPGAPGAPGAVAGTQLAFTGVTADVLGFLGLALVAFGAAFMLVARRNEESLVGMGARS